MIKDGLRDCKKRHRFRLLNSEIGNDLETELVMNEVETSVFVSLTRR